MGTWGPLDALHSFVTGDYSDDDDVPNPLKVITEPKKTSNQVKAKRDDDSVDLNDIFDDDKPAKRTKSVPTAKKKAGASTKKSDDTKRAAADDDDDSDDGDDDTDASDDRDTKASE